MNSIRLLVMAVVLGISQLGAATWEDQFIRKPGEYSLDGKGSTLVITKQPTGWALKATWGSGDGSSSVTPEDSLRTEGWFVFVEKPDRLWIFNGADGGILVSHSEKTTAVASFSRDVMAACPRKVWDALPRAVRAKYRKVEPDGGAKGSQPVRPETNPSSAAGGSRR